MDTKPVWLKTKGYLHITPSLNAERHWKTYVNRIKSKRYVAKYAFYPLIHRVMADRKYKKPNLKKHSGTKRAHSHTNLKSGEVEKSIKKRPLHYASHFDSLIYAYYAHELGGQYEAELKKDEELNKAVLAYRSIPISDTNSKGKSNIHFAQEVFREINTRVEIKQEIAVLAIDLKSFFSSISHNYLYKTWTTLLNVEVMPADHQNVFNACTNFSYILYDHLRKHPKKNLDEAKLARIRKKYGYKCFFSSNEEFRNEIRKGNLRIYKNPFRRRNEDGKKEIVGIPQGLPISAVLSNLYLLEFDKAIIENLVKKEEAYYRRYSDDIIILCPPKDLERIDTYINQLIEKFEIEVSTEKTERFLFQKMVYNNKGEKRITVNKIKDKTYYKDVPLNYLGFEFRGYSTLIKSTNIAKYYRRLISIIKRRSKRAIKLSKSNPTIPRAVYLNQAKKLYNAPLKHAQKIENKQVFRKRYNLVLNDRDEFEFNHFEKKIKNQSNYISYLKRCNKVFQTKAFTQQLKKRKQIVGKAINRHLAHKKD